MSIRSWLGPILLTASIYGCARPTPPPPTSVAKFATSAGDRTRLTGSVGFAVEDVADSGSDDAILYAPVTEVAVSGDLGERYEWSVTSGLFNLAYEGAVVLLDSPPTRAFLAILHGAGVGVVGSEFVVFPSAGGGLLAAFGPQRTVHAAARYWVGTMVPDGDVFVQDLVVNVGVGFFDGALRWELAFDRMTEQRASSDATTWYVISGVSFTMF